MPIPSWRLCSSCEHKFWTASPDAMACPSCGLELEAAVEFPHCCQRAHVSNHGGECMECAPRTITNGIHKEVQPWVNRV